MANLFSFLFGGKYPSTSRYEAKTKARAAEYSKFLALAESDTYQRFVELDELVHSGEFEKRVYQLKHEKFKETEAYRKWGNYKTLSNLTEMKDYRKFVQSGNADRLNQIQKSAEYREFRNLQGILSSKEFEKARSSKEFQSTEFYRQQLSLKKLRKHRDIRFAVKWEQSVVYKNYKSLVNSDRLKHFETLQHYVQSNEFIQYKKEIEDSGRFRKSEEYRLLNEFNKLDRHKELIWFRKMKTTNSFAEEQKWMLTFEDDFDRNTLNAQKWMSSYYWGKALLNDSYAVAGEKQFFKAANLEIRDSIAHLTTKPEKGTGKAWDPILGFVPAQFNYSSAILSTGHSFRQQYGRFEAKIRMSNHTPVQHHFWMVSESISPQIDVFQYGGSKTPQTICGYQELNGQKKNVFHQTIKEAQLHNDFYIVSLDWSPNRMEWKINGVTVHSQTSHIPNKPMYLIFSSHLFVEPEKEVHAELAIDWVKCYQLKN